MNKYIDMYISRVCVCVFIDRVQLNGNAVFPLWRWSKEIIGHSCADATLPAHQREIQILHTKQSNP